MSDAGRAAMVAHVERWLSGPRASGDDRAALVVVDVDLDDALPVGEAEELTRRLRLGRRVERAIDAQVRPGDAVARIDAGRFAVLRSVDSEGAVRREAGALARGVETALVGRPEGYGARVTAGGTTLRVVDPTDEVGQLRLSRRGGREALGAVTTAMLEGKLLTDDRVVVVVTPGG